MCVWRGFAPSSGVARSRSTTGDWSTTPPDHFFLAAESVLQRFQCVFETLLTCQASLGPV